MGISRNWKNLLGNACIPKGIQDDDFSDTMYIADYDPINHETIVFDDFHGGKSQILVTQAING